ncbi:hypothetical protein [Herbidospora sp. NBRC 101105]|uniref:hypothetical protein n=1 Tax=Herbidospora sp. NBRC 101105 TaxID=3032195 RepID=UPI0025555647|nr:hypothetical protein [Herbidospora sp. NBRC 101105]
MRECRTAGRRIDLLTKRGWTCAVVFLELNGKTLIGTDPAEELVLAVTAGRLGDVTVIAKNLRELRAEEAGDQADS